MDDVCYAGKESMSDGGVRKEWMGRWRFWAHFTVDQQKTPALQAVKAAQSCRALNKPI